MAKVKKLSKTQIDALLELTNRTGEIWHTRPLSCTRATANSLLKRGLVSRDRIQPTTYARALRPSYDYTLTELGRETAISLIDARDEWLSSLQ